MDHSLDSKPSPSKEMPLSSTQPELTVLHDKISALKETIADLTLSLTTSRAKISSQESAITALRLPNPSNPNEQIAKLATENADLKEENERLEQEFTSKTAVFEEKVQKVIADAKLFVRKKLQASEVELLRRHNLIMSFHATILSKDARIFGMQKQLDSVYGTLQRQSDQMASQQRQHARKLAAIEEFWKQGVKNSRKRALMWSKRDAKDLEEIMEFGYESEEDEESEDEEDVRAVEQGATNQDAVAEEEAAEEEGEQEQPMDEEVEEERPIKREIELVDLIDDDDEDEEDVVAGAENPAQDPVVHKQQDLAEQTNVGEKSAIDIPTFDKPDLNKPAFNQLATTHKPAFEKPTIARPTFNKPLIHDNPTMAGSSPPKKRARLSMEGA
ncbi:hypothetical protein D6D01_07395 [Aureobasidium pullulans]|uniref:Uncharacterized protein n=1 Tax=Aureobasidium pullulans TaxID=5580 RepID=A0A4S9KQE4_AURPU|nr:hypothetical protein D6D01_07395 [Aureobasidium pullulans]